MSNTTTSKRLLTPKLRLAILASLWCISTVSPAAPIRISTSEYAQDPQKVAALQNGVSVMRNNSLADNQSATYRTSFAYWANTHGYFGTGTYATNLPKYIAYRMPQCLEALGSKEKCDAYYQHMATTPVPNDGFTDSVWGTCQHGNLNFLPWHRMYLYFYEKTLRKASGDPNFTLPYWDYYAERSPDGNGLALPTLVRGATTGTLYDEYRTEGLNTNTSAIDPDTASAAQAFMYSDFTNFSNNLQGQPHGAMHCAVGTGCSTPDLGFVPIAGLDPVFYMHHANIDRLWQCWLNRKANGQPINLAWAKANLGMPDSWYDTAFSFADENGNKVTLTIADVFTPGVIDVGYDHDNQCDVQATPPAVTLLQAGKAKTPLKAHSPMGSNKAIQLKGKTMDISLSPQSNTNNLTFAPLPKTVAEPNHSFLILDNVQLQGSPALTYKVYIARKSQPQKAVYIATFNYFGMGDEAHGDHSSTHSLGTLVYKVSDNLMALGIHSVDDLSVRFVPTNLMAGPTPSSNTDSGVTIGNIRLETMPPAK